MRAPAAQPLSSAFYLRLRPCGWRGGVGLVRCGRRARAPSAEPLSSAFYLRLRPCGWRDGVVLVLVGCLWGVRVSVRRVSVGWRGGPAPAADGGNRGGGGAGRG